MRLILILTILFLAFGSCGKKSDPKYQGYNSKYIKIV